MLFLREKKKIPLSACPLPVYWIIGMLISKTQTAEACGQPVCFCCLERKRDEPKVGDYSITVGAFLINPGFCKSNIVS